MATTTLPNMRFYSPKISNVKLNTSSRTMNRAFCSNVKAMAGDEARFQRAKQQQVPLKMLLSEASPEPEVKLSTLLDEYQAKEEKVKDIMERVQKNLLYVTNLANKEMMKSRVAGQQIDKMVKIVEDVENRKHKKAKIPWLIRKEQKDYKLRLNMPGMSKNDVKVWIEENKLVVKAEKIARESHDGQANSGGELSPEHDDWPADSYGRYHKRISLPENIELEKIKAQVKDGVLYITIPKARASAEVIGIDVQ